MDHGYQSQKFMPIKPKMKKRRTSSAESWDGDANDLPNGQNRQSECKRVRRSTDLKTEVITHLLATRTTTSKAARYYNLSESTVRYWLNSELGQQIKSQLELSALKNVKPASASPYDRRKSSSDLSAVRSNYNEKSVDLLQVTETNPIEVLVKEADLAVSCDDGVSICSISSSADIVNYREATDEKIEFLKNTEVVSDSSADSSILFRCEQFDDFPSISENDPELVEKTMEPLKNTNVESSADLVNSTPCERITDFLRIPKNHSESTRKSNISAHEIFVKEYQSAYGINLSDCNQESITVLTKPQTSQPERKIRSTELKKEVITRTLLKRETKAKIARHYNLPESTIRTWLNSDLGRQIKSQLELIMKKYAVDEPTEDDFEKSADFPHIITTKANNPIDELVKEVCVAPQQANLAIKKGELDSGICSKVSSDIVDCQGVESNAMDCSVMQEKNDIPNMQEQFSNHQPFYAINLPIVCKDESIIFSPESHTNADDQSKEQLNTIESLENDENQSPNARNQHHERKCVLRSTALKVEVITRVLITGETKAKVCRYYNLPESTVRTWMKSELGQQIKSQLKLLALKKAKSADDNSERPFNLSAVDICYNDEKSADFPRLTEISSPIEALVKEANPLQRAGSDSGISLCSDASYVNVDCQELNENYSAISSRFERLADLSSVQADVVNGHGIENDRIKLLEKDSCKSLKNFHISTGCEKFEDLQRSNNCLLDQEGDIFMHEMMLKDYKFIHGNDLPATNESVVNTIVLESESNDEAHSKQELETKQSTAVLTKTLPMSASYQNFESAVANMPMSLLINYCTKQLNLLLEDEMDDTVEHAYIQRALTRLDYCRVYSAMSQEEIFEIIQFAEKQHMAKIQRAAEASIRLHQNLM